MKKCLRITCDKMFEPKKPKAVYCSDKCRVYANREKKRNEKVIAALKGEKPKKIFKPVWDTNLIDSNDFNKWLNEYMKTNSDGDRPILHTDDEGYIHQDPLTPKDTFSPEEQIEILKETGILVGNQPEKKSTNLLFEKPVKRADEAGIDYAIRVAEWKALNNI